MDAKDHTEHALDKNSICRLEWIAWAMEAARRHKEAEQQGLRTLSSDGSYFDEDEN